LYALDSLSINIMQKFYHLDEYTEVAMPIKNWGPLTNYIYYQCHPFEFGEAPPDTSAVALTMLSKSKLYDVVQGFHCNLGLLVSTKFLQILTAFNLPKHKSYPVCITHKGKQYDDYVWIHILRLPDDPTPINWEKTLFYKYNDKEEKTGVFQYTNIEQSTGENASFYPNGELWLTAQAAQYDLFAFRGSTPKCYIISERLYQRLVDEKIMGIQLSPALWVKHGK
jgi:hypothetical protein